MNKPTDNDIIKALECCIYDDYAKCHYDCPFKGNCRYLSKRALDLIKRQQTEIDRLIGDVMTYRVRWVKAEVSKEKERAEAIKEFAERLKTNDVVVRNGKICLIHVEDLDDLVKEMEEENNV